MVKKKLYQLVLFSASRDQKDYFTKLKAKLSFTTVLLDYKQLPKWWGWTGETLSKEVELLLKKQVEILQVRKKNTVDGRKRGQFYWRLFRWWQMQRAKWIFYQAVKALVPYQSAFLGVWNGKKFRQAIWVEAAQYLDMKVVYFETGPLPGYSMVDAFGVDAFSGNPREKKFYQNYNCRLKEEALSEKIENREKDFGKPKILFVPFQVVEDSNIYLHSPWIHHMRQLFDWVERLSDAYPNWVFWLKEHPACNETYPDLHERIKSYNGKILFVNEMATTELVEKATAVMTINSTVGMEALQAGKQVLVLGEALYAIEGLTQPIKTLEELIQQFEQLVLTPVDEALIKNFICYLKQDYAVPGDAMKVTLDEKDTEHWRTMEKKLQWILSDQPKKAIGLND